MSDESATAVTTWQAEALALASVAQSNAAAAVRSAVVADNAARRLTVLLGEHQDDHRCHYRMVTGGMACACGDRITADG
jgi:hypothetical protein